MSTPLLWTGAALLFGIGVAHSVLGERYILIRLFRRPIPKLFGGETFTRRTLRFAWHITSLAWWGFGAQMAYAASTRSEGAASAALLRILALTFLASALTSLVGSRGRHYSWIAFLAIAACAWWGA